jgi:uncharacterized protein
MNPQSEKLIDQGQLPGGSHWSLIMRRGRILRLTDLEGGANVGMLFYNPEEKLERYNAPDTLKCQHTFKLSRGHCLYSDMGRIFCSIVEDSVGWHDTVGGNLSDSALTTKWQPVSYQQGRNNWTLSGEHSFKVELAKYGLSAADIPANLNLFSKTEVSENGDLSLATDNSKAGDSVELRFEMDTLVILHTCPHPMNSETEYPRKPVQYEILMADPVGTDDFCKNFRPENQRGFENNRIYLQEPLEQSEDKGAAQ